MALVAADLVANFDKRIKTMDGKGTMFCMSRRIAVELHNALIALRPEWTSAKDDEQEAEKDRSCIVKVVMTGSAEDGAEWQPHIRNKENGSLPHRDRARHVAYRVRCALHSLAERHSAPIATHVPAVFIQHFTRCAPCAAANAMGCSSIVTVALPDVPLLVESPD